MGQNKWRYSKKNPYLEQSQTLLERVNHKANPLIQTVVHRPNLHYSKIYQKRIYNFLWNKKKIWPLRRLIQLSISTSGLRLLDIETQLNSLKIKWIQRLLNPNNALWKNLMLYLFNIILNYNQGLALFRQKQVLRSNSHKYLQKQNNEDFFIRLLNVWLHFTNSSSPTPTIVKEIYDQPIFANPQTKLRTYFL